MEWSVEWGLLTWFMYGQCSRLSLNSHLACLHIWPDSGPSLVDVHSSLSQDGFQCEGFWEAGGTYYGLAPSLPWILRTFSVPVWAGKAPWPQEWEKCGCFVFHFVNQGLMLLLVSWGVKQGTSCGCSTSYNCFSWKTITKSCSALTIMAIQWWHAYLCKTYC